VILVVDYDPVWPLRFERLRREYTAAMAAARVPVAAIEHVGSTAVPGLAAKPVIDCDIVVAGQHVTAASQALTGLGFTPEGDLGIPLRWAFKEPERLAATNTYVVVQGSLSLRNHLAVRDVLRADPGLREQYAAVKRRVGAVAADIDEYVRGKNAMVQRILAAAGLTEAERAAIDARQIPVHDEVPRSKSGALHLRVQVITRHPCRERYPASEFLLAPKGSYMTLTGRTHMPHTGRYLGGETDRGSRRRG